MEVVLCGHTTLIDQEDLWKVASRRWRIRPTPRGSGIYFTGQKNDKWEMLHRFLIAAPKGSIVDHINGNPLDNRKSNLRLCTRAQNCQNQRIGKSNSSGYKGVSWETWSQKWHASITANGKQRSLGRFSSKEAAAKAYNKATLKYHGQYARLNVLPEDL